MLCRMHLRLPGLLLVAALLVACGTGVVGPSSDADPTKAELLAAADAAARSNGGSAPRVEAVRTTRGRAADPTGHSQQDQDQAVWVVQVSGDEYECGVCSRPFGGAAPRGDHITLVLRASDLVSTDAGIGPSGTDLAAFGEVLVLRQDGG